MKKKLNRFKEHSKLNSITSFLNKYAYFETVVIVALYLGIGYLIDINDICILKTDISYILILLAVITLFHGFENGMLALGILAIVMYVSYPIFEYTEFLVALMMTMIFSEFHYYWTKKIKNAEISSEYRGVKLEELSKAFYSLKISHDQLEKNYVIKPMSIRNSIEYIIDENSKISLDEFVDKRRAYYQNFLSLLEKSFNVSAATIIYKERDENKFLNEENAYVVYGVNSSQENIADIISDYLVDKAIGRNTAIYISDEKGEPSIEDDQGSLFIAAIPSVREHQVSEVLAIEKMPFMSFNRENLTSISILLEYFSIEIDKEILLEKAKDLEIIEDNDFRFEYERVRILYTKYHVQSTFLVIRIDNELQAIRVYEKIVKMLRALDMLSMVHNNEYYYITLLFPLHDKAAALGYLKRLHASLTEEKDRDFNYMTFDLSQVDLMNKYYREDYAQ